MRIGTRLKFQLLLFVAATNVSASAARSQTPLLQLVQDLRLDANREDFPGITNFSVGPRNQIAVPIRADMQVILFDSTGKRTATIGRRGAGRGEFEWVNTLGWKVDTLWVNDPNQRRVSYFLPNGKLLRTISYVPLRSVLLPNGTTSTKIGQISYQILGIESDSSMIVEWLEPRTETAMQRAFGGVTHFARLSADGIARVVLTPPARGDDRWAMVANGYTPQIPFLIWPQYSAAPFGGRYAHMTVSLTSRTAGSIAVSAFKPNGDSLFARTIPFVGAPISQFSRDSALDAIGKMREGGPEVIRKFQEIARRKMPAVHLGAKSMLLGVDNTTWIQLHDTEQGNPWMVLDGKGEIVGRVVLPRNSQIRQASASRIWAGEKDDDGLTSIVRYRIDGMKCASTGC